MKLEDLERICETPTPELARSELPRLVQLALLTKAHRQANANGQLTEMYRLEGEIDRLLAAIEGPA